MASARLKIKKKRYINPIDIAPQASYGPGVGWNGVGGSGATSPPVLAFREAPMPAIRWIVSPYERFAQDHYVGVDADCLGDVAHVDFYIDSNNPVRVHEWTILHDKDVNDAPRMRGGYWVKLNHTAIMAQAGEGANTLHIYAKAYPNDPRMQPRVIGPLVLHPASEPHDMYANIRLDGAGGAYTSIKAALDAARAGNKLSPKFTITQTGFYNFESSTAAHYTGGRGYCVITHAPGVVATIGKAVLDETKPDIEPRYDAIEFRGRGIVIDHRNFIIIQCSTTSTTGGRNHRLNGCKITTSEGTPRSYYWGHGMKTGGILRSRPSANLRIPARTDDWLCQDGQPDGSGVIEDCLIEYGNGLLTNLALARGNMMHDCIERALNGTPAAFDNYSDRTGTIWFRTWRAAMNITYTGPAETATVAKAGNNNSTGPFRLTENGVEVLSMTLGLRTIDPWHSFQQIADYINGVSGVLNGVTAAQWAEAHPGWTATIKPTDIEIRTSYMGATATEGGSSGHPNFTTSGVLNATSCKNTTVYLATWNEVHSGGSNFYVGTGKAGNWLHRNNVYLGIDWDMNPADAGDNFTNVLFDVAGLLHDMLWVNCIWDGGGGIKGKDSCSLSHVVFKHCSSNAAANPFCKNIDEFTGLQNSSFTVVSGATSNGGNLASLMLVENSCALADWSGFKLNQPLGAVGNFQALAGDTRYVNAAGSVRGGAWATGRDFRPAPGGLLVSNLRSRKTRYDLFGNQRSELDAIGAISINSAAKSWPDLGAFPA